MAAPNAALRVIDAAMQAHGAAGVCQVSIRGGVRVCSSFLKDRGWASIAGSEFSDLTGAQSLIRLDYNLKPTLLLEP